MDGVTVHVSGRGYQEMKQPGNENPTADAPKTSEYAYFRNVRNGAVHGHHQPLHKGERRLDSSKNGYCCRDSVGASYTRKRSTKDLSFSFLNEKEGPSDHCCVLRSPLVYERCESELAKKKTGKSLMSHFENVTPVGQCSSPSALPDMSLNTEDYCFEKGVFAAKRHKMQQWATQTLFSDMENHPTTGSDLVSALLSWLFPKGNMNDDIAKGENDKIRGSLTLHKTNNQAKGLPLSHKRDQDKDPPKFCSGGSREIVSLGWDDNASGCPFPSGGVETYVQNKPMDHYHHSQHPINRFSKPWHEFSGCLPFERCRPPCNFRFEGLDEFGSAIEHSRDEPCRLLLEWDSQIVKDRADFSSNMNEETAITLSPRLTTTCNVHQQLILDNMLNAEGLFSASLSSNCHLGFIPLSNYGSIDPLAPDYGLNFDDVRYAPAELGLFSQFSPKLLTVAEDMNAKDVLDGSNAFFSHNNHHHWLEKNVQDDGIWQECLTVGEFFPQDFPSNFHPWQYAQNDHSLQSISQLMPPPSEVSNTLNEGIFNSSHLFSNFQDGELEDDGFLRKCLPVQEFFQQDLPSVFHPWQFPENDNSLHSIS